jgi:hypothetical protein
MRIHWPRVRPLPASVTVNRIADRANRGVGKFIPRSIGIVNVLLQQPIRPW